MELLQAIDEFSAVAFMPEQWPGMLDRLARAADADGATVVFGSTSRSSVAVSCSIESIVRDYFETRAVDDPREDRAQASMADGFRTDFDMFSREEIAADPFYQDFLRRYGYGWHGVALLALRPVPAILSLKRTLARGPYEGFEIDALNRALPHLRSAAAAAAAVHGNMACSRLMALAEAGLGAMTLDRGGRVIEINAALTLDDGLSVIGGEPRAAHRGDQAALDAAILRALRPERPSALPPPRRIALRRPVGRHPLVVDVLPLIGAPGISLFDAAALLVVTDLDRTLPPEIADLRHLFGLTAKEAELAARLSTGMPLETAAEELRISRAHARQRLKAVFQKTDTHRQAELVALLARLRGAR
jgi:DNA-binding CsgD family transcriptional regulator